MKKLIFFALMLSLFAIKTERIVAAPPYKQFALGVFAGSFPVLSNGLLGFTLYKIKNEKNFHAAASNTLLGALIGTGSWLLFLKLLEDEQISGIDLRASILACLPTPAITQLFVIFLDSLASRDRLNVPHDPNKIIIM